MSIVNSIYHNLSEKRKQIIKKVSITAVPVISISIVNLFLLSIILNIQIEYSYRYNMSVGTSFGPVFANLSAPDGIAVDSQGNVYVADTYNHRIQKFAADGRNLSSIGRFGDDKDKYNLPVDAYVNSKDNVFVIDKGNQRIQIIETEKFSVENWFETAEFDMLKGIAIGSFDIIYVVDTNNRKVHRLDMNRKNITSFGCINLLSKLYFPSGIDIDDRTGYTYIADSGNNQVKKFNVVEKNTFFKTNNLETLTLRI